MHGNRDRKIVWAMIIGLLGTIGTALLAGSRARAEEDASAASLRLVLNLSARRLHVYENGERTRSYTVSVGKPKHRTPVGSYRISRVVWNPWWHPPNSKWARGKKPTPPGPSNPMGRVKMYFRELYYIHGTPQTGSLGQAVSHGCVRMSNSNAIALARKVHEHGSPNVKPSVIDKLVSNSRSTRTIWLKKPVPFQVRSSSAEVNDGRLEIFAWEDQVPAEKVRADVHQALEEAGYDPRSFDDGRLDALIASGLDGPAWALLDDLREPAPSLAGEH